MFKKGLYVSSSYTLELSLQAGLGFFILVTAARTSSPPEFGFFAFTLALASVLQVLAAFGSPLAIYGWSSRSVRKPIRRLKSTISVVICFSFITYVVSTAIFFSVYSFSEALIYAFAAVRIFGAFSLAFTSELQARNAVNEYVPLKIITYSLSFVAVVFFWLSAKEIFLLALIWAVEPVIYGCALWLLHRRSHMPSNVRRVSYVKILHSLFPFAIHALFVALYLRFDQMYVQIRFSSNDLAIYASAARTAEIGNMAVQVAVLALSPIIIKELVGGTLSMFSSIILCLVALGSLMASGIGILYGDILLGTLFGASYASGYFVLAIYILSTCMVFYGGIGSKVNAARGTGWIQMRAGLYGGGANIVLTIALAEVIGLVGVALATVVSYTIAAIYLWSYLPGNMKLR